MEFSEDFELPPIEVTAKPIPELEANDDAFYAAGSYGQDPVNDYTKIYSELTQDGYSESLEAAKRSWQTEQSSVNKEAVLGILNDQTIPREQKKNILSTYSVTGYISSDLKDKYVQKMASLVQGETHLDAEAQDANIENLPIKQADIKERKATSDYDAFIDSLIEGSTKTIDFITPGRIIRNPNGTINFSKTLTPKQIAKDVAGEITGFINFFSSAPNFILGANHAFGELTRNKLKDENLQWQEALNRGIEWAETDPIASIFDWRLVTLAKRLDNVFPGFEKTVFEPIKKEFDESVVNNFANGFGTVIEKLDEESVKQGFTKPGQVSVIADAAMIFGGPLYKGTKAGVKAVKSKVGKAIDEGTSNVFQIPTIDVRPNSPIDNTVAANPGAASKIIKAGIEDSSGQTATAIGAGESGVLIHKYVMPKTLQELPDVRNNPDLHKEIIESTKNLEKVLEDTQFDPNVIDIDVRLNDIGAVTKILNEKQAPTYQQSNSRVNVADNIFEFKAVFGRDSSYFYNSRESVITAYDNLKTLVESLPAEERGSVYITDRITGQKYTPDSLRSDPKFTADVMDNKQFAVEWEYKKEYDLLDAVLSGPDSVKTVMNFFGLRFDLSKTLQAPFGKWITPTGKFNPVLERGLGRAEERAGYLSAQTLNIIKQELGDGKLKNELATVVFETQTRGKDILSIPELRQIFGSKLSKAQYDALFRKQVFWRQVNYFDLALTDRARRNELLATGFNKGVYKEGKYTGAARTEFAFLDEGGKPPTEVWDVSLDLPVLFELDKSKTEGVFDIGGKQLIVLEKGITDTTSGRAFEYALVGDKVKLDVLPQKVVRRIPGYSPLLYKEHFFLDLIPRKLTLNGFEVTNPNKLKNYYKTVAAASTKIEIDALKKEFERRHPDYDVVSRKATESLNDKISLYEVHGDVVRNAMKKGQQLPSLHGLAKIEDPLVSLIKSSRSLATMDAWRSYKTVFETYWVKNYKEFFPRPKEGETIPPRVDLIERLPSRDMTPELEAKYNKAVAEYELYTTAINVGELPGITQKSLIAVADILEGYKVPSRVLREVGQKTYPIRSLNKLGSLFFITLAPIRQWIVQLQPIADFTAASALKGVTGDFKGMVQAPKNLALALATRVALLEEARMLKPYKNLLGKAVHSFVKNIVTKEEFDANVKAIKESGLMQSIDHNLMINQILTDTSRPLIETPLEKAGAITTMVPSAVVKTARTVGFDAAEMLNRLFMWHMAKDFLKEQNPGKDWNSPVFREQIAYEGNRLAGGMNRAQSFPYQRGVLSSLMQFGAIMQKQFLLGFQEGGSVLSNADRARLLAARGILWGTAGVVGAKLITDLLTYGSNDPDVVKYKNEIDRGLADRIGNPMFKAMFGDDGEKDPDLNFSKTLNPYGESNLGIPYVDLMIEVVKLLDGDPAGFRFPAIGALGRIAETINTLNSWVVTEKITDQNLNRVILEAARFSSGMDNWAKGQLMLAINDKITKQGQRLGLNSTKAEAYAQMMFGITTHREEDLWAAAKVSTSETDKVKKMAQNIHKEIVKIINDPAIANDPDLEDKKRRMGNAFLSVLAEDKVNWPSKTIQEVREQIWEIDRRVNTTVKQSLTSRTIKKVGSENDKNNQELQNKLKDSKNESTFRLINIIRGRENP
jgi:hypothetical protein